MRAIIAAPIFGRNGLYGALCIAAEKPEAWTTTDVQAVASIANLIGLAIENPQNQRVQILRNKSFYM
jgi:GAF domain-containing protein